jgi:hypothetical protein
MNEKESAAALSLLDEICRMLYGMPKKLNAGS